MNTLRPLDLPLLSERKKQRQNRTILGVIALVSGAILVYPYLKPDPNTPTTDNELESIPLVSSIILPTDQKPTPAELVQVTRSFLPNSANPITVSDNTERELIEIKFKDDARILYDQDDISIWKTSNQYLTTCTRNGSNSTTFNCQAY